MRLYVPALVLLLAAGAFGAYRHKLEVDAETEDGILLQRIQQEPQAPRKLALLEKFAIQFPNASSVAWVYEQLLPIYAEAKESDKVIATAERLLALDPTDVDSAHYALQAAEFKKDPDLIRKYAAVSWDLASKAVLAAKPSDPDDVDEWAKQIEFAKQLTTYSEYVLAIQAAEEADPQKRVDIVQALESRNPQSKFLASAKKEPVRIHQATITPEEAEKGLADDPNNEDYLLTLADVHMRRERDLPRVLNYALRLLEIMQKKAPPDGYPVEDWEKKRARYLGSANWLAGVVYGKQGRYGLSDRYLRASLANIRENVQALAAAYFYLGYDNYAMAGELRDRARAVEAARYSKLCAAIDGPFQPLAQKNLEVLRNEFNVE